MRASACLLVVGSVFAVVAFAGAESPSEEADRILHGVLEDDALPSISVAVSRDGLLVYRRALGLADIEHQVEATPDTRYSIGSISKSLSAATALKLSEQGRLDLDAPVQDYCTTFPVKPQVITVRQLLSHTSGVRHYDYRRFEEDFLNKVHYDSLEGALTKFAADPLVAEPGTTSHYSSWGYVVVGCAIEGASGATYAEAIRSHLLQPVGMSRTGLDVVSEIIPDRARGYSRSDSGELSNAVIFDPSDRYPAGGLLGTPSDLVKSAGSLLGGGLLSEESLRQMWTPASLTSGEKTEYGLGWEVSADGATVSTLR